MATRKTLIAILAACFLASCAPMKDTRGNFLDDDRMKKLQIGVSTKAEVEQTLGTPTTTDPFDDNTWFYVGEKTSTEAFFRPKVDERKIVILKFDEKGLLADADTMDETEAKPVEVVKKETPAPGREMNAFEQFLSNLGKFNQGSMAQKGPGR